MVNFWRPQPTLPGLGLQYSISRKTRTVVSLSSMKGVFAESLLRKQAWRNRKKGRVGCLHQNIFTRKVTEIAIIAIIIHIPRPPRPCIWRPASASHTSPRPILDVPKSLVSRPRVTSPTHTSQCPRLLVPVPLLYTAMMLFLPARTARCINLSALINSLCSRRF